MMKQAFRTYLTTLHPRNFKKLKEQPGAYLLAFYLVIYPVLMRWIGNNQVGDLMILLYIRISPYFIMLYSNLTSKFLMPKAMFLSPMKEREREEYINCVLVLKIGIPVLIGIVVELIWSIFYGFYLWRISAMIFIQLSIGISEYICFTSIGKGDIRERFSRKDKNGKTKWAWQNVLSEAIGIVIVTGFVEADIFGVMPSWAVISIGIGLVIILIFDVLIVIDGYKKTIQQAGDYELTFQILGKVQSPKKYDLFAR